MSDPVAQFEHDHGELTKQVFAIREFLDAAKASAGSDLARLTSQVDELRDELVTHFAREEEGLFPFVAEQLPELREAVDEMQTAHDAICGALLRLSHATQTLPVGADLGRLAALFARFESAYVAHAKAERDLLRTVGERFDAPQRRELAELVKGL